MTLAKLNAQIAASREHLRELYRQRDAIRDERRANRKTHYREILRLFDDENKGSAEIARIVGLPDSLVRQFLHSRGRTKRGRDAVRSQLAIMAETQR